MEGVMDRDQLIGKKVFVSYNPDLDGRYMIAARCSRSDFTNQVGEVTAYSDSHGLCYEVLFANGRAWYEPEEITVL
jgi:hypothetical protein